MLKSLKDLLYQNEVDRHFENAKLNDRKELMKPQNLQPLIRHLQTTEKKQKLIAAVIQKARSRNLVQKLKGLMAVHYFIRETWNPELIEFVQSIRVAGARKAACNGRQSEKYVSRYIEKEIIEYYQEYLQKLCVKEETMQIARKFEPTDESVGMIEIVSHGFQAINFCNLIIRTQQSFNKMGRYYLGHTEMISLYLMYLDDLTTCNGLIKNVARLLVRSPEDNNPEEIRHNFLFLTESQKASDRLAEFYFNRYYLPWVKTMFSFPKFMTINGQSFDMVRKSAKKVDYKMVKLVKRSSGRCGLMGSSVASQGNASNRDMNSNSSFEMDLLAKTMGGYPELRKRGSSSTACPVAKHTKIKLPHLEFLEVNEEDNIVVEEDDLPKEASFSNGLRPSGCFSMDIRQSSMGLKQSA